MSLSLKASTDIVYLQPVFQTEFTIFHFLLLDFIYLNKDQTVSSWTMGFNIEINITRLILISLEIKGHPRNNLNSKKKKNINFQWNLTLILKKTSTFDCCSGQAVGEEGWPAEADGVELWLQSSYLISFPRGN